MNRITRRQFIKTGTALGIGMELGTRLSAKENIESRPNILWICPDQQRWDTIRALGNKHIHTPNLDRLVGEGVSFDYAHVTAQLCTPSRSGFLTGMYPSSVKGCKNGASHWPEVAPLVPKLLKDEGYLCGLSGKLHLSTAMAHNPEKRPKDDGYSEFHYSHSPHQGGDKNDYLVWLWKQGYKYKDLRGLPGAEHARCHQTTWCSDMAIDFMKNNKGRPWLFSVNIFDPHGPFNPPADYVKRFDLNKLPGPLFRESDLTQQEMLKDVFFQSRPKKTSGKGGKLRQAKYWAQIELIDENIGRMLKALEDTAQLDNTLIIFTSDHGDSCGDHGLNAKGCRFYEGLVRVPLIFWWPGKFKKGLRSKALVESTDIAPTLMELTGNSVPKYMQGKSLLPILTGMTDPHKHRKFVRCEFYDAAKPRSSNAKSTWGTMLRTEDYKLCVYHGHEHGELYDMKNDPYEFTNLWDNPKYEETRLTLLKQSFEETMKALENQMPILSDTPTGEDVPVDFKGLKKLFDDTVIAMDTGPKRIGRY
ncbi:Arylsulfatase [Sedimentisphaera cyanobacteriorum]|uniref:Arylsulfatase n=1 Tax=Sedimentisphaera cyanobacteriorum TaxID=1940790 RepID=A0A1Q2HPE3_9BACT|nr:sulfatase-like hydrolase/transferase [Sedimentisphaera cyanobacteriorum]AQQ09103.1 Arylsulfatase [Sedimentisphaera cyanobacteriorum]